MTVNKVSRVQYWTKWRVAIEVTKFIFFLVIEVLVIYIILIELFTLFGGTGMPFNLPGNLPTFMY